MKNPRGFSGKTYSPLNPDMSPKEREKTRRATQRLIRSGKIRKLESCEHCGRSQDIEVHHPDYRDPANVMWLCRWCHADEHVRIADEACFGELRRNAKWRADLNAEREAERLRIQEETRHLRETYEERLRAKRLMQQERKRIAAQMATDGASLTQIAKRLELTISGASRLCQRNGIKGRWHNASTKPAVINVDDVRRMASEGLTQTEIGEKFGVSTSKICKLMQRHRISPSRGMATS